jgi:myosin-1
LVMLTKVGESDIVENIKKRYDNDLIYTYIGPVLISMNPYKDLGIVGEQVTCISSNFILVVREHLSWLVSS